MFLRSGIVNRLLSLLEMNVYSSESIIKLQRHIIITGYGSTLHVFRDCHGICILPIHSEIQFLLSISRFYSTAHVKTKLCAKYFIKILLLANNITFFHFVHVVVLLLLLELT